MNKSPLPCEVAEIFCVCGWKIFPNERLHRFHLRRRYFQEDFKAEFFFAELDTKRFEE